MTSVADNRAARDAVLAGVRKALGETGDRAQASVTFGQA
jgi:hypothetical protein